MNFFFACVFFQNHQKNRLKRPFLAILFRKSRVLPPHPRSSKLNSFVAGNLDHEECALKKLDTRKVSGIIFGAIEVGSVGQNFEFF